MFFSNKTHRLFVHILLAAVSLQCSRFAISQTVASPDTAKNCMDLHAPVPEKLATISAALGICPQVSAMTQPRDRFSIQENQSSSADNLRVMQSKADAASREINRANLLVGLWASQLAERNRTSNKLLKVSSVIIGGVGAGAGGALRLVNDKTVMHDGTVVSMAGGLLGASVNLLDIRLHPSSEESPKKLLSDNVRNYVILSENPQFNIDSFRNKPSALSRLLLEMSDGLEALQLEMNRQK